jgi:hypothetical protein
MNKIKQIELVQSIKRMPDGGAIKIISFYRGICNKADTLKHRHDGAEPILGPIR